MREKAIFLSFLLVKCEHAQRFLFVILSLIPPRAAAPTLLPSKWRRGRARTLCHLSPLLARWSGIDTSTRRSARWKRWKESGAVAAGRKGTCLSEHHHAESRSSDKDFGRGQRNVGDAVLGSCCSAKEQFSQLSVSPDTHKARWATTNSPAQVYPSPLHLAPRQRALVGTRWRHT